MCASGARVGRDVRADRDQREDAPRGSGDNRRHALDDLRSCAAPARRRAALRRLLRRPHPRRDDRRRPDAARRLDASTAATRQAGVVVGAATVGMALGAPWRGRLVDRLGLRRAIAPSVVVESAVWLAAPHLSYEALIGAVFVAGLFLVPVFSVSRQSLSVLVPLAAPAARRSRSTRSPSS